MAASSEIGGFFAANFRRVRKQVGISQEALAFRAGLHRTEIGLLERGERVPKIDTLIKLAAALEVKPGVLLEGIKWTGSQTVVTPGSFRVEHSERGE
jgi:transcriptional regulator with XRE-family HTH domain